MRRSLRSAAPLVAVALLLVACGEADDPTVDTAGAPEETVEDETPEETVEDEGTDEAPEDEGSADDAPADDEQASADDAEAGPTPDPELVADPCAPHEGREGDAFIDVASPVDGQTVTDAGAVELVGCSNVPEANVVWELQVDGAVVADGFTTAECGTGCVGAFEETLDLSAASGEAELHVISPDLSDGEGSEIREVVALTLG